MKIKILSLVCLVMFSGMSANAVAEAKLETIKLLEPQRDSGKPLMQALAQRKSAREFSSKELPLQVLSNLLWAANGVNRPSGRRTVPSAHDAREIDTYVAKKEGLYFYDADKHVLEPVFAKDIRSSTGKQGFVKDAPVVLVFVGDLGKLKGAEAEFYTAADAGFVSQNVYLYCASEGLSTVVLGWVNKDKLAKAMKLKPKQKVILTQPVGYPK